MTICRWADIRSSYSNTCGLFRKYMRSYGGFKALILSPYLHASVLLTVLAAPAWWSTNWWEQPIVILPSLLGFSLGGYAIWLAWGDDKFRSIVTGSSIERSGESWISKNDLSPYIGVSATFVHYIVVQVISILYAVMYSALHPAELKTMALLLVVKFMSAIGYCLFMYSLMMMLAAGMGLFRVSIWYDEHRTILKIQQAKEKDRQVERERGKGDCQ